MAVQLVSTDKRKNLAVYEQDGVRRVIKVRFDKAGKPILNSEAQTRLQRLFEKAKRVEIQDTAFARPISVTKVTIR